MSPFFVMMKLVPIAALELMASISPIHLSWLSVLLLMVPRAASEGDRAHGVGPDRTLG